MKSFKDMLEAMTPTCIKERVIKAKVRAHINERFNLGGELDPVIDKGTAKLIDVVGVDNILKLRNAFEKVNATKEKPLR